MNAKTKEKKTRKKNKTKKLKAKLIHNEEKKIS